MVETVAAVGRDSRGRTFELEAVPEFAAVPAEDDTVKHSCQCKKNRKKERTARFRQNSVEEALLEQLKRGRE